MQQWTRLLPLVSTVWLSASLVQARTEPPTLIPSPAEKVFVALGFDDNDDVELIIHGHFPDSCYKVGPASARFNPATGTVEIEAKSYRYPGICAQVVVNFIQTVKAGILPQGTFAITVNGVAGIATAPLVIDEATSSGPDDFLYAPVSEASLDLAADGSHTVTIKGEYPFMFIGCMIVTDLRAYVSPGNTIVVLPIAELVDTDACDAQADSHKFAISKSVGELSLGEYLIHVRVIEGNSLNRYVELR